MRGMGMAAMAAALLAAAGCATRPTGIALFEQMQRKASRINSSGGMAALGVGKSGDLALATKMANTRGREEVANIVQTRVNALVKDFREEVGEAQAAEFNTAFSAASKHLTSQVVQGIAAQDVKSEVKAREITVYALMVQNPKLIKEYFANPKNTPAALYDRFRASQAFGALEKEIQQFEEFLKLEQMHAIK
jgi:hypothetical protein